MSESGARPLGPADLKKYLEEKNIQAEIIGVDAGATSETAANSLDAPLDSIVKSVLFMDDEGRPILVIMGGEHKLQQSAFARLIGRKKVRLATREEVVKFTGYPAGGVPPVGVKQGVEVFVDEKVFEKKRVFAGGGTERHLLKFNTELLKDLYINRSIDLPVQKKNLGSS